MSRSPARQEGMALCHRGRTRHNKTTRCSYSHFDHREGEDIDDYTILENTVIYFVHSVILCKESAPRWWPCALAAWCVHWPDCCGWHRQDAHVRWLPREVKNDRELHGSGGLWDSEKPTISDSRPAHGGHTTWSVWDTSYQILVPCSANNVARRAQGNLGCTGGRGVCTHAYSTQSERVRSMSDISVMGIILIIHAQSIPHLTQTKQDISSSHSSRQLWQILCGSWNNPILPSEVPRWMRCQWSPGASEMGNKVWIKKSATSAKKAWWLGITLSSIQQNYIIWQKIWINQVFKEIRNHQIVAMYGVTTRSA